ncbi:hypothetical protein FN846DRAFT_329866 [Sphaerosporella brunnea]|uniref:Uncharacterized protein n=1 Tax=Sphaerosporella brunnea TaxID=1250544 RepID=A0A5J5EK57_9PEZI|nr:hypothetical protein FN846DRAFT_329866 [Sphaerosporella brunnea]
MLFASWYPYFDAPPPPSLTAKKLHSENCLASPLLLRCCYLLLILHASSFVARSPDRSECSPRPPPPLPHSFGRSLTRITPVASPSLFQYFVFIFFRAPPPPPPPPHEQLLLQCFLSQPCFRFSAPPLPIAVVLLLLVTKLPLISIATCLVVLPLILKVNHAQLLTRKKKKTQKKKKKPLTVSDVGSGGRALPSPFPASCV